MGLRGTRQQGRGENYIMRSLMISTPSNIFWVIKSIKMRWAGRVVRMGRGEVHSEFSWVNLREINHLEDPGVDGRVVLIYMFRN